MGLPFRRHIEGLRALAIVAVVLFHFGLGPVVNGYLGVDIFFVISGFLITSHIGEQVRQQRFRYLDFLVRRTRRLAPALIGVVIVSTLFALVFMTPYELKVYAITAISAMFGISNVTFFGFVDYFSPKASRQLLMMAWSLSVEQQFYLLLPPLIVGLVIRSPGTLAKRIAVITAISFVGAAAFEWYRPDAAFYLLPFRAWEFGGGALLATMRLTGDGSAEARRTGNMLAALGMALIGVVLVMPFPVSVVLLRALAVLGSMALIAASGSALNRHVLATWPMVAVGRYSYSWYLWHWPPIAAMNLLGIDLSLKARITLMAGTLGIAMISHGLIEERFRRSSKTAIWSLRRYAAVLGIVIAPLAVIALSDGLARLASPRLRLADADVRSALSNPCLASYGRAAPNMQARCVPVSGKGAVALVGDSHANSLVAGVKAIADEQSLALYQMTKSACLPVIGYSRVMDRYPMHHRECAAFMARVMSTIQDHPEIRTVVLAGYWSSFTDDDDRAFVDRWYLGISAAERHARQRQTLAVNLRHTVDLLRSMGRRVIVVQDVPHFSLNPYSVALAAIMPQRAVVSRLLDMSPDEDVVRDDRLAWTQVMPDSARAVLTAIGRNRTNVSVFDPVPRLCSPEGCRFRYAGHVLYGDAHHLSRAGAIYATSGLSLAQN